MYCWVEYPQMAHQENCDCCRCIQIPQKPYEECVCDDTQQVETNSNPLIYHHYYQTPCTVCGRTHYQQSTSVCGVLPLECDCKDMSSFFSTTSPRLSSFSNKTDITKKSVQYADNCTLQGSRKSMSARNDDGFFPAPPSKKTLGLQTCKDTGVGDCPACLGARTSCHQSECQLCCEPKTCGPEYSKCPFAPAIEVQTDPICEFSQLPCRCSGRDTCGLPPCGVAETCEYSDIECRCPAKSCNLKGSCIIIDEGDEDFYHFSQINCDCADIGCDTSGNCIEFDSICECGPQPFEVYNTVDEDYDGQDFYETYASQGVFDDFPKQSISCQAAKKVLPVICINKQPQSRDGVECPGKKGSNSIIIVCPTGNQNQNRSEIVLCSRKPSKSTTESCISRTKHKSKKDKIICPRKPKPCGMPKKKMSCVTPTPKLCGDQNLSGDETDHYTIIVEESDCEVCPSRTSISIKETKSGDFKITAPGKSIKVHRQDIGSCAVGSSVRVKNSDLSLCKYKKVAKPCWQTIPEERKYCSGTTISVPCPEPKCPPPTSMCVYGRRSWTCSK